MDTGLPAPFDQIKDGNAKESTRKIVAALAAGYHSQHNTDDTHGTITASGSISEYGRTLPQGVSTPLTVVVADFAGATAATWTVVPATTLIRSSVIGKRMFVDFNIVGSSVGGGGDLALQFILTRTYRVKQITYSTYHYIDNGTNGVGRVVVGPFGASGTVFQFNVLGFGNWAASVGLTGMVGQVSFELA